MTGERLQVNGKFVLAPGDIVCVRVKESWSAEAIEELLGKVKEQYPDNLVVALAEPDDLQVAVDRLTEKVEGLEKRVEEAERNANLAVELLVKLVNLGAYEMRYVFDRALEEHKAQQQTEKIKEDSYGNHIIASYRQKIMLLDLKPVFRNCILQILRHAQRRNIMLANANSRDDGKLLEFDEWIDLIVAGAPWVVRNLRETGGLGDRGRQALIAAAIKYVAMRDG